MTKIYGIQVLFSVDYLLNFLLMPCFLTLKAPITTEADDKFCNIFPNFQIKIRYDMS